MRWAAGRGSRDASPADADERRLVRRSREGDPDAFAALVYRHRDRIYRLAMRMTGADAAEDLTQQAFVRAWQGLDRFDGAAAFGTWIYRIAINLCLDHLRRVSRFPVLSLDDIEWVAACDHDPADQVADADDRAGRRRSLARALAQLPDDDRLLLHLRVGEERSYEAIAELLNLNVRTVGSRLYRARARLHHLIAWPLGEEESNDLR